MLHIFDIFIKNKYKKSTSLNYIQASKFKANVNQFSPLLVFLVPFKFAIKPILKNKYLISSFIKFYAIVISLEFLLLKFSCDFHISVFIYLSFSLN